MICVDDSDVAVVITDITWFVEVLRNLTSSHVPKIALPCLQQEPVTLLTEKDIFKHLVHTKQVIHVASRLCCMYDMRMCSSFRPAEQLYFACYDGIISRVFYFITVHLDLLSAIVSCT